MGSFFLRLDNALNALYRYCGYGAALCMAAIGVLVCLSILTRLLSVYVPGLTEYSGYAMAAGSFLALAYTLNERAHIRVELFLSRLGSNLRYLAEIWCLGVATIITCYLAWYMIRLVYFSWQFEERSEGADAILLWKPQFFVMVGAIVLAIAMVHQLVKCLANKNYAPR